MTVTPKLDCYTSLMQKKNYFKEKLSGVSQCLAVVIAVLLVFRVSNRILHASELH